MSARLVRRSFASPFVVTLAAALPAACYVQPGPQRASDGTRVPTPGTPDHSTTTAGVEQGTSATTVVANPPRPAPVPVAATEDRRWHVTRARGTCASVMLSACPTSPPGQPALSCNPPQPLPYPCSPSMVTDGETSAIVQFKGQTTCQIEYPPIKCPAGAICNPPPPQKVACPQ